MEELTEIVKNLNSGEIRLIRKFYKLDNDNENLKRLELFNHIKNGDIETNEDAVLKLYNSQKIDSKFSHLKTRLKNDILNIIIFHEGEMKYVSPFRQATFDCRKLIIKGDILLSRGANKAGLNILNKAEKMANKYQLPSEQIIISDLIRSYLGVRKGLHEYNKHTVTLEKQLSLLNNILESKDLFNQILLPNAFFKNREKEYVETSKKAVEKLGKLYKSTDSAQIGFIYLYTGIYYHELRNSFDKSLEFALRLLDLLEGNPPIYAPNRIAGIKLQIANLYLKLGDYDNTKDFAKEALKIFRKGILNELVSLEILFFAHYYSLDFDEAESILTRAFEHKTVKENDFFNGKWLYFKASNKFCQNKFSESLTILRQHTSLAKDKTGWFIGWNLLELLNLIEIEEFDIFYYRMDSFKLLIRKQKVESPRVNIIMNVLDKLSKRDFNFEETYKKVEDELNLLSEAKDQYYWDPLGFETLRFDIWFLSKVG